jgi:hypothetical protein
MVEPLCYRQDFHCGVEPNVATSLILSLTALYIHFPTYLRTTHLVAAASLARARRGARSSGSSRWRRRGSSSGGVGIGVSINF